MGKDKEYFEIYYQNHKKEYQERRNKWCIKNPGKAKAISKRYRENNLAKRKVMDIKGPILKRKKFIPFKKRISPELLAKIEENTRINNQHIKFYSTVETGNDKFLVRNILKKERAIANE